jgi:hypothetical protein
LTIGYTLLFLFDNEYNKYNWSFEQNIDNKTYDVNSCFVIHVGSNVKESRVKPYTWYIVHITTNCVKNWILVIMYNELSPICVSLSIGV